METTELQTDKKNFNNAELSPYGLKFLRHFRTPKFEAHHHRRVPIAMRKHNRGRSKSSADILDGVNQGGNPDEEIAMQDANGEGIEGGKLKKLFGEFNVNGCGRLRNLIEIESN